MIRSLRLSPVLVLDLVTSYGANLARAGSMFAIIALLSHRTTTQYLAAFIFLRSMLGFLNNVFAGAAPAAIAAVRTTPALAAEVYAQPVEQEQIEATLSQATRVTLAYESPRQTVRVRHPPGFEVLFLASGLPTLIALAAVYCCTPLLRDSLAHLLPANGLSAAGVFAIYFGGGLLLRLHSDAAGGALQSRRLLWLDNLLVVLAEAIWVIGCYLADRGPRGTFLSTADYYFFSGVLLWLVRWIIAAALLIDWRAFAFISQPRVATKYLAVGSALAIASLGDFLYAPANYVIINRFLDPLLIADYGPALQVDQLLLLAVSALSAVILPRAVALYAAGDYAQLRRAYIASMLAGVLLLMAGSAVFLAFSGPLLRLWLGEVPPGTQAILPWILVHTIIGGTAGIGRAMLIAMDRVRLLTVVTLGAGVLNVSLAFLLAVGLGWELRGIVVATIITVTVRNAIWMPWYILRALRRQPLKGVTP